MESSVLFTASRNHTQEQAFKHLSIESIPEHQASHCKICNFQCDYPAGRRSHPHLQSCPFRRFLLPSRKMLMGFQKFPTRLPRHTTPAAEPACEIHQTDHSEAAGAAAESFCLDRLRPEEQAASRTNPPYSIVREIFKLTLGQCQLPAKFFKMKCRRGCCGQKI